MSRRRKRECPTPSKRRFGDCWAARDSYLAELDRPALYGRTVAAFAYHCVCGSWHRTHRDQPGLGGVALAYLK